MLPIRPDPLGTPYCPVCQCRHFPYATLDGGLYWCDDSPADHGALAPEERARELQERNLRSWTAWNPDSPKQIKAENPTKGLLP